MSDHARFSPSSSDRWLTCHKSMLLKSDKKDEGSSFAKRGTALHSLADDILKEVDIKESYDGYTPTIEDIEETVLPYVEYVRELDADLFYFEEKVHLTEECYGTADCIAYKISTRTLHVVDLKAGQGVLVSGKNNSQMRIYAIGAIKKLLNLDYKVDKVVTHVVQPGLDNYGVEEVDPSELKELFLEIKSTIKMINNGEGFYAPSESACRWCDHKTTCPKLNELAQKAANDEFKGVELAEKLNIIGPLKLFIKAIEEEALEALNQDIKVPGYKTIKGQGNRKWKNPKEVQSSLLEVTALTEKDITKPSELLSPAQVEKVLKKNKIKIELDKFIMRPEGKIKLVKESAEGKTFDRNEEAKNIFK